MPVCCEETIIAWDFARLRGLSLLMGTWAGSLRMIASEILSYKMVVTCSNMVRYLMTTDIASPQYLITKAGNSLLAFKQSIMTLLASSLNSSYASLMLKELSVAEV
jgi:hypothetical protein